MVCRFWVYCSPFSVAAESMQKMGRQASSLKKIPMLEIDVGVSVFCNLIGWYFYRHVGFKKGREVGLTLEGEELLCEGWLQFLVGQKRSSSSLVILKSHPMLPAYFCRVPFMKMLTSCLLKSMIFIKYFESDFLEK
jgi:hypothetical protein